MIRDSVRVELQYLDTTLQNSTLLECCEIFTLLIFLLAIRPDFHVLNSEAHVTVAWIRTDAAGTCQSHKTHYGHMKWE
jgi:hypothetical protein